ncbi:MAG TPA: hypothetical protein VHT75_07440 [Acidimicrobiales bacterium]|jgi:hypothetical protein|nr:hypothetical protein [Acidimicrobiales bacterium]
MSTLMEAAALVGGYVWSEERLFETLGGWVPQVAEPAAKIHMAAASQHHAWHASLWRDRLPELREAPGEGFVVAPPSTVAFFDALASSPTTLEKLVGVYRVALPRQITAYTRHRRRASPITDGPTIRALELVLTDELADWRDGEALVQSELRSTADVARATAHQGRLEALLVAGDDSSHPGPIR